MADIAMAGDSENGSVIAVFTDRERAAEWLDRMVKFLRDQGLIITDAQIDEINTKFRAGVVFKKEQMEFDFGD